MLVKTCKRIKNKFTFLILPGVVGIATAGLFFSRSHFIPSIESQGLRYLLDTTTLFFYVMCFISYYFAIKIRNDIPDSLIMPRIKSHLKNNHPLYIERRTCDKER